MREVIFILGRMNGAGLEKDAALIKRVMEPHAREVVCFKPRDWRALLFDHRRASMALHLERVAPFWGRKAQLHLLVPNQERFPKKLLPRLKSVDHILCKTQHAVEQFTPWHPSVHFIGFTSEDCLRQDVRPDYGRFLHVAGRSTFKGTDVILELWAKHPEWPELILVQHPDNAPDKVPTNVRLISRVIAESELRELQNSCGIHLCPSLSEGWGHYIVEAMSCRAVVVTTDGAPMNELVQPDRGVLVGWERSEPRHLGINFFVDPPRLEQAIAFLITRAEEAKVEMGERARKWFMENDMHFMGRLRKALQKLN